MPLIINDERIDEDVIAQEMRSVSDQQRQHPDELHFESQEELADYARENVLCRVLLQQEAAKRIEAVPAQEVEAALRELKEQYGGDKEFYEAHQIDESADAEIKGNLEKNLKVQKLMDELCADVPAASDEEVRAYFDEHTDEFVYPEEIHASHIVKRPADEADADGVYEQMKETRGKLLAGEDIAKLAREQSDCSEDDGDLGFFSPGQMVEEFEAIVFSMADGEISPVFLTQFGYHVVKVHERRPERPAAFEDVRDDIRERLLHDRKNDRVGEFVEAAKGRATIVELPPEPDEPDKGDDAEDTVAEDVPAEDTVAEDVPADEAGAEQETP